MDKIERRILLLSILATVFLALNFIVYSMLLQVSGSNLNSIFKAFIYLTFFVLIIGIGIMMVNWFDYRKKKKSVLMEEGRI